MGNLLLNGNLDKLSSALEQLTESLKEDKYVLCAYIYGSARDKTIWELSDIDVHVIVADGLIAYHEISLKQNDFLINIDIFSREEFKNCMENRQGAGFLTASIFANSTLLFSRDPLFDDYYNEVKLLGKKEAQMICFRIAAGCILPIEKACKFIYHTDELLRALPYIHNVVEGISSLILFDHGVRAKKVNIPVASAYEPALYQTMYYDLFENALSKQRLNKAMDAILNYFRQHQQAYFKPLFDFLKMENRVFSASEIDRYFQYFGIHGTALLCEWLVHEKLLNRATAPTKLTPKSKVSVSEAAYFLN